ncbi:MAG: hypothetical protein ISP83_03055 [Candidatus Poseidonia sp.]|nr:hypothetical protein [Poseidonia sp.]MBL6892606.1 hypothetical protein [Poseidonia sp.]
MRDLLNSPFVQPVSDKLHADLECMKSSELLHFHAPANLEGLLAIGQLEAACLDAGIKYSRRFYLPKHHRPRDEILEIPPPSSGVNVVIASEEETWQVEDLPDVDGLQFVPLATRVQMGNQHRIHHGSLDCVIQCAAIAALLAPNGRRVRKLRPYMSLGLWLRGALDTTLDPIHSAVLLHLKEEGSVRIVPLPEVGQPRQGMIPHLPERRLIKLHKAWPTMNVDERKQALSELVLPCLTDSSLSTPRLEELVWKRMLVGQEAVDLASQAEALRQEWPEDADASRIHAAQRLDHWLRTGSLMLEHQATV